jgi:hypothetical protein
MKRRVGVILVSLFHKDYVPRYIIMKEKVLFCLVIHSSPQNYFFLS